MRPPGFLSALQSNQRRDHMEPGLRGRYRVQSPKSRVETSTIGTVIRMPCLAARLSAISLAPGRNAETRETLLPAARVNAVVNAASIASGCATASGPTWPLVET